MARSLRERLGDAALGLVGAPFRMHGRNAATGVDCVGVAVAALAGVDRHVVVPDDYRLIGGALDRFDQWAAGCGLVLAQPGALTDPGDILLCAPGPGQFHVMIDSGPVLVHAHLGLRRVTALPKPAPWPLVRRWQLAERT